MYKILIVSDTHRKIGPLMDLIDGITDLNHIFHLGDLVRDAEDIEAITNIPIDYVAGNCDFYDNQVPTKKVVIIKGKRFFLTHGHNLGVKYSLDNLRALAREEKYDGIFFGHTHQSFLGKEGQTLILNPGSISEPRNSQLPSYAIIQIDDKACIHATLDTYKKNF